MEGLELHADTRGVRSVQLMAIATGIVALSAAVVVVWFDLGGGIVLAALGVLLVAAAGYFTRFRLSPPLVYAMDDEGLQVFAYCDPTTRLKFGRRAPASDGGSLSPCGCAERWVDGRSNWPPTLRILAG